MKPRPAGSLKQCITDLVEACGGQQAVAQFLNKSQSQVQRYTDPLHPAAELSLSQVLLLEAICRKPIVTAYLALQARHVVVALAGADDTALPQDMAQLCERAAALLAHYTRAIADGVVTVREARELKALLHLLMASGAAMLPDLDAIIEGGMARDAEG